MSDFPAPALRESDTLRFARGFRFRHDAVRGQWVVLGPERAFVPDDIAVEVLQLVDGARSLGAIIDTLARRFDAPRDQIAADVVILVNDLSEKGVLKRRGEGLPAAVP